MGEEKIDPEARHLSGYCGVKACDHLNTGWSVFCITHKEMWDAAGGNLGIFSTALEKQERMLRRLGKEALKQAMAARTAEGGGT